MPLKLILMFRGQDSSWPFLSSAKMFLPNRQSLRILMSSLVNPSSNPDPNPSALILFSILLTLTLTPTLTLTLNLILSLILTLILTDPDVIIGLTVLAYRYSGLRKDDYVDIIDSLTSLFVREIGPTRDRFFNSHVISHLISFHLSTHHLTSPLASFHPYV